MKEIIACCGLICTECPAYIATQANDYEGRKRTAEKWSKELGLNITPDDCICDGCQPSEQGRLGGYCNECPIRACCLDKNIPNCAHCDTYPCSTIKKFSNNVEEILRRLDAIREQLLSNR